MDITIFLFTIGLIISLTISWIVDIHYSIKNSRMLKEFLEEKKKELEEIIHQLKQEENFHLHLLKNLNNDNVVSKANTVNNQNQ